ncbi:uridine phosphorylase 2-like isoform X2 [Diadema setosum]|uniref:uridine phosphorylase 2-like isoform X2 n=1 Tax=Diadema setosum TaxID=31175 RepID=UPI003B3A04DF
MALESLLPLWSYMRSSSWSIMPSAKTQSSSDWEPVEVSIVNLGPLSSQTKHWMRCSNQNTTWASGISGTVGTPTSQASRSTSTFHGTLVKLVGLTTPDTPLLETAGVDAVAKPLASEAACDGGNPVLGRIVTRPTQLSQEVADDIQSCQPSYNNFSIIKANTLCASDFFEGQARLDGALCQYSEEEKMEYIRRARDAGVRNIEMESAVIAGMCNAVNIKAAVVCVTLLDRLKSDQVLLSVDKVHELERRPMEVVIAYIRKKLQSSLIEMRQDHKI